MSASVFAKALSDRWRLVAIVSAFLAAMNVLVMMLFGSLGEQYGELMEALPAEILAALGAGDLGTPVGWLNAEMFSFVIPIGVVAVGILVGVGAIAGEEDKNTLNMLLAAPVDRMQVAWSKVTAMVLLLALVAAATFTSLVIGAAIGNVEIGADKLLAGSFMGLLFGIFFASLAFGIGAGTGRSGLAAFVSAGVAVVAFVVHAFLPLVKGWEWVQKASPYYWYLGPNPLANGVDVPSAALFAGLSAVFVLVGVLAFNRRDIGV
ncbi:MAG: ABC transporter permease subunit [Candidatus Eisenbacteria bacterium]